jgi:hypothetical protein
MLAPVKFALSARALKKDTPAAHFEKRCNTYKTEQANLDSVMLAPVKFAL